MVSDTSVTAYIDSHDTQMVQVEQLHKLYLRKGPLTDREAGSLLEWHPSVVSARRDVLRKKKLVVEQGRKKDLYSGYTVKVWGPIKETFSF